MSQKWWSAFLRPHSSEKKRKIDSYLQISVSLITHFLPYHRLLRWLKNLSEHDMTWHLTCRFFDMDQVVFSFILCPESIRYSVSLQHIIHINYIRFQFWISHVRHSVALLFDSKASIHRDESSSERSLKREKYYKRNERIRVRFRNPPLSTSICHLLFSIFLPSHHCHSIQNWRLSERTLSNWCELFELLRTGSRMRVVIK